jgi:hypothetical protein
MRDLETILADHAAWVADGRPARDCRQANLRGANLAGVDLTGANLRYAGLRGANLRGANLRCAELPGANLSDAILRNANLRGAILRGANLRGANLRCAHLRYAYLAHTDLRCAIGITSRGPVGIRDRTIYAVDHGDRVMVQAGCRWETADEVIAAIERDYADSALRGPYIAAVREMVAELEAQRAVEVPA